jgi:hypothetical protein
MEKLISLVMFTSHDKGDLGIGVTVFLIVILSATLAIHLATWVMWDGYDWTFTNDDLVKRFRYIYPYAGILIDMLIYIILWFFIINAVRWLSTTLIALGMVYLFVRAFLCMFSNIENDDTLLRPLINRCDASIEIDNEINMFKSEYKKQIQWEL